CEVNGLTTTACTTMSTPPPPIPSDTDSRCCIPRYLSHGQEWSEALRVQDRTRVIKFSLDPVWNEQFSLPVRRAGAVLKVKLWDWNLSIPDDPLGHFEVKIGGDLLAQKTVDRWYVLRTPSDLTSTKTPTGSDPTDTLAHDVPLHEPSIEERLEAYGKVRLELRFEFNELAETCSHIWPEEPPQKPRKEFSPNRIFYNWLLLQQLLLPYLEFLDGAGRVLGWRHSITFCLLCLVTLALLVVHPGMLIVTLNAVLLWIVTSRYWSHVIAQRQAESSGERPGSAQDIETGAKPRKKRLRKKVRQLQKTFLPPMEATTDREVCVCL
ncbi:unnamed protein product, partial [Ectocarpus sp. 13 AM-2016]